MQRLMTLAEADMLGALALAGALAGGTAEGARKPLWQVGWQNPAKTARRACPALSWELAMDAR